MDERFDPKSSKYQGPLTSCGGPRPNGESKPIDDLRYENVKLRAALEKITKLGRVCQDFDQCKHKACEDSCGACLIALSALTVSAASDSRGEPPTLFRCAKCGQPVADYGADCGGCDGYP